MQFRYSLAAPALAALVGIPAVAGELGASIEVPKLNISEYHRPYVASWVETADGKLVSTVSVWYDLRTRGNEGAGTKWLKDMRTWWRKGGRELAVPVDGVTSATRPVGKHTVSAAEGSAALPKLAAGSYKFVVEAAREGGGRETLAIPFQWPPTKAEQQSVTGSNELGEIRLDLKP